MTFEDMIVKKLKERFSSIRSITMKNNPINYLAFTAEVNADIYVADILSEGMEIKDYAKELSDTFDFPIYVSIVEYKRMTEAEWMRQMWLAC